MIYHDTAAVANIPSELTAFFSKPKKGKWECGGCVLHFRAAERLFKMQEQQTEQEMFHGINSILSTKADHKNGK